MKALHSPSREHRTHLTLVLDSAGMAKGEGRREEGKTGKREAIELSGAHQTCPYLATVQFRHRDAIHETLHKSVLPAVSVCSGIAYEILSLLLSGSTSENERNGHTFKFVGPETTHRGDDSPGRSC